MTEKEVDTLLSRYTKSLRKYMSRLRQRKEAKRRANITLIIDKLKLEIENLMKEKLRLKKENV